MMTGMREEYDIKALNPRKNPYVGRTKAKQQITMNMNTSTVEYFTELSSESEVPYQVPINLYLDQCVKDKKKLQFI